MKNQLTMISTRIRACLHAKHRFGVFPHCEKSQLDVDVRFYSSSLEYKRSSLEDKQTSFSISHLVRYCGFSVETAESLMEKVQIKQPKRGTFLHMILGLDKSTREHKMKIYKSWGWSENEFDFVLKNYPYILLLSDEKIANKMDFLVNKLGCKAVDIARYPSVLRYSLENTIIPRYFVYQVLFLKGLLRKRVTLCTLLTCTPNGFEERFVTRYKKDVPQLLNVYQGRTTILELGFTSEDVKGVEPPPLSNSSSSTGEHTVKMFTRWGLSEEEVDYVSKEYPRVFHFSDKKISNTLDFLVNKMGYKSVDVVRAPSNFQYNLEIRIIPRCLVCKLLLLRGLLLKEPSLSLLLSYTANEFEERFVTRYEKDIPQLLNVYQGKTTLLELGITSEDVKRVKPPLSRPLSRREQKMKIYQRWGLSENEVDFASKKYPAVLLFSDEKISNTLDFLVTKMGYKFVEVTRILDYDLEMRIIPRCLVYKVLILKGLLLQELALSTLLRFSVDKFEKRFVTRYKNYFPQLLNVYEGKITLLELGFTWEDVQGAQPPSLSDISKSTQEHKMKMYKRLGWSEKEVDFVLKKCPHVSDEKISKTVHFLVNKMGYRSVDIARYPSILEFSLETRIVPRCLVYKVLILKGLLMHELSLSTLLRKHSANEFEERFVTRYQKDVPQLLNVYQGKTTLLKLGFTSKDVKVVKPPPF